MQTILPEFSESVMLIRLWEESPLVFLNDVFPGGLAVRSSQLSLNGRDFYELPYEAICCWGDCVRRICQALAGVGLESFLSYCVSTYQILPIPAEWAIEIGGLG